jgi:hypothetical protein
MQLKELKQQIAAGKLFLVKDRLLTKEQHERWENANAEADYYDLLQGVRKVLLSC